MHAYSPSVKPADLCLQATEAPDPSTPGQLTERRRTSEHAASHADEAPMQGRLPRATVPGTIAAADGLIDKQTDRLRALEQQACATQPDLCSGL